MSVRQKRTYWLIWFKWQWWLWKLHILSCFKVFESVAFAKMNQFIFLGKSFLEQWIPVSQNSQEKKKKKMETYRQNICECSIAFGLHASQIYPERGRSQDFFFFGLCLSPAIENKHFSWVSHEKYHVTFLLSNDWKKLHSRREPPMAPLAHLLCQNTINHH